MSYRICCGCGEEPRGGSRVEECECGGIRCHEGCCFRKNPVLRAAAGSGLYCCSCDREMYVRRRPGLDLIVHAECPCGGWNCFECEEREVPCLSRGQKQLRHLFLSLRQGKALLLSPKEKPLLATTAEGEGPGLPREEGKALHEHEEGAGPSMQMSVLCLACERGEQVFLSQRELPVGALLRKIVRRERWDAIASLDEAISLVLSEMTARRTYRGKHDEIREHLATIGSLLQ